MPDWMAGLGVDMQTKSVVYFGVLLFFQSSFIVLTFITRDTLFVKTFGKDAFPYASLFVSFEIITIVKPAGPIFFWAPA